MVKYVGENTDEFVLTKDNYYSKEADAHYISIHTFLDVIGGIGTIGCEARGIATYDREYSDEDSTALLVGSYVDAYFEGTLDKFIDEHDEIFTKTKKLRAEFENANKMIERAKQDEMFMRYMQGDKQVVMTGYLFGLWWKIRIDNLVKNKKGEPIAIVDLKTCGKPFNQSWYINDYGRVGFIEKWNYDYQLALYQEIYRINTGLTLPTYICAITKEKEPDIAVICLQGEGGSNMFLENALEQIKNNAEAFKALVSKEIEPVRCNRADCMYCRRTKQLTEPIFYQDLIMY